MFPRNDYHRVPSSIIGKVYASSMLVLLNSRMPLDSEEMPVTFISALRFATVPANAKNIVIEADDVDVDLAVDMEMGPSRSSEP